VEIKNMDELKDLMTMVSIKNVEERNHHLNMMWFYIGAKKKIQAIKEHRIATGEGLKESKDHVDWLMERVNSE